LTGYWPVNDNPFKFATKEFAFQMKLKSTVLLFLLALGLSSCGSRYNNPEELTVPIIQALQSDDFGKIECMLPNQKQINETFEGNRGTLGYVFYNKYTKSYRMETLLAHLRTSMDIIKTMSKENNLDWENVTYSEPKRADASGDDVNNTVVTTHLKFDKAVYDLSFRAINIDNRWCILDDIYLIHHQDEEK
jgi:hypothetical protein